MLSELIIHRAYATEAGTQRFADRHGHDKAADAYGLFGQLRLSSIGLGTYLGPSTDAADEAYVHAVIDGIRRGINVIDTASNYRCQRSERAVGKALRHLLESGEVYRSEILVTSKAGFVPFEGCPPPDVSGYIRAVTVERGLCLDSELMAGCHCMAGDYLTATLDQSRANLGLETIDAYFVHNPETQLQMLDRAVFRERLRDAFTALEAAADRGWIRVYGLATWSGVRAKPHERDYISLEDAVQVAQEVAGPRHRFKALQVPVNLAMPEAHLAANQIVRGQAMTVLQAAERLGLMVFASSPLHQGKLIRRQPAHVPDLASEHPTAGLPPTLLRALQFSRSLPGVATALVGMGSPEHVADNARLLRVRRAPPSWLAQASAHCLGAAFAS
jgi:aryl-alcohol dehydrogenase-like predicted oxidoreductase